MASGPKPVGNSQTPPGSAARSCFHSLDDCTALLFRVPGDFSRAPSCGQELSKIRMSRAEMALTLSGRSLYCLALCPEKIEISTNQAAAHGVGAPRRPGPWGD